MGYKFDIELDKLIKRESELLQEYVETHLADSEKKRDTRKLDTGAVIGKNEFNDGFDYDITKGNIYELHHRKTDGRYREASMYYMLGSKDGVSPSDPYRNTYLSITAITSTFNNKKTIEIESPLYSETIEEISGSSSLVQYIKSFIESVESKINDGTIAQAMQDAHSSDQLYKYYSGGEENQIAYAKQWLHDIRLNFSKLLEDMPELGIKLEEIGMSDLELAERKIEQQDKMLAAETARADSETARADSEKARADKAEADVADLQAKMAELQKQLSDTRAERDTAQKANQRLQTDLSSSKAQVESLKKRIVAAFTSLADSFKKKPTFGGHKHDDVQQGIKKAAEAAGLDMSTYQVRNPEAPTGPENR